MSDLCFQISHFSIYMMDCMFIVRVNEGFISNKNKKKLVTLYFS